MIVVEFLLVGIAARAERASRGMRVGGGDHDVLRRDAGRLLDQPARLDADAAMQSKEIAHHEGKGGLAVIEHQTARVKLVMRPAPS